MRKSAHYFRMTMLWVVMERRVSKSQYDPGFGLPAGRGLLLAALKVFSTISMWVRRRLPIANSVILSEAKNLFDLTHIHINEILHYSASRRIRSG